MTDRTIASPPFKGRREMLQQIQSLKDDFYFSFGVPQSFELPPKSQSDPRVHTTITNRAQLDWTIAVEECLSKLTNLMKNQVELPQLKEKPGKGVRSRIKPAAPR